MTTRKLFLMNLIASGAYVLADIYATSLFSSIFLVGALISFGLASVRIEKLDRETGLFLSRFLIMLPMIELFRSIRYPETIGYKSFLLLVILSTIAYDFFWRSKDAYAKQ